MALWGGEALGYVVNIEQLSVDSAASYKPSLPHVWYREWVESL
jgi:hypothetical protein